MPKFVYDFTEGNKDLKDLLGGKGANLAEMTNIGLPVPPGFTITTDACRHYLAEGATPDGLDDEVSRHLKALEATMGRKLGDPADPLLVSVRSGAKFSMPGMMDTVLNVGLSDDSVDGLAAQSGNERFAWDAYRRLIQMFGKTVLGIDGEHFEHALDAAKRAKGAASDTQLDAEDLKKLTATFKDLVHKYAGREFPQDPREQMDLAVLAVFDSWNSDRAVLYRRQERIPADLGTAVSVVAMVFGNLGDDSGTGVAFTRDPGTGAQGVYGDYLQNAQGEDVVAGIRNTVPLQELESIDKTSYDQLMGIMRTLENHYRDLCDIEFTIERGKLWMLQTRVGKRTAAAAFRIATQLVKQGMIDLDEALTRVSGAELSRLMFPRFDTSGEGIKRITKAISASPGAAVGKAVFDSATAVAWAARGEQVILVRRETNPEDLNGMIAAEGVLTSRGGKTSHAAVVARGMGKTCVCGAEELEVDAKAKSFTAPHGRHGPRGRRHLDRRHIGRGLPRRGPRRRVQRRAVLRGRAGAGLRRPGRRRARADEPRGRQAPSRRARQRGQRSRLRAGEKVRRDRGRPGQDRAHVPRRAPPAGREPDTRRDRRGAPGRTRHAGAAAARRFRGDPRGDGRAAGDGPADRPAAARVPPRPHRPQRQGGAGRRQGHRAGPQAA